jgi:hypothetical protein
MLNYEVVKAVSEVSSALQPSACELKGDILLITINFFAMEEHAIPISLKRIREGRESK